MRNVLIIGLGLIGGSLGLALRQAAQANDAPGYEITGYDRNPERLRLSAQMGAIDHASAALPEAIKAAQLILLATPVLAIQEIFTEIAPFLAEGSVVTDTGSTKAAVLHWARDTLPPGVQFIGGHPMAGTTGSLEEARPDLFQGATYCLVPGTNADTPALEILKELISAIGAVPLLIDAAAHDRCVAAISHVPFIVSAALVEMLANDTDTSQDLMRRLASSGFRDTTRLAAGDPTMYHDISLTNREAIVSWLDAYIEQLQALQQMLAADEQTSNQHLLRFFEQARQHRKTIIDTQNP